MPTRGGAPVTFDGRETAPHAATRTWFFKDGQPMEFSDAQPGGKSVGVPGNVRMMALAHQRYGKLPWAALFEPAIRLARDGFKITPAALQFAATNIPRRARFRPRRAAIFYQANGQPQAGRNHGEESGASPHISSSSRRLGPDSFYVGPNAQAIAAAVSGSAAQSGAA